MTALPVIVGMGGINAAGRTSFHQGYRRIVLDALTAQARSETFFQAPRNTKLEEGAEDHERAGDLPERPIQERQCGE